MTVCPRRCCSTGARMRATWSTEPPGGNTATSLIGCLLGQAWAAAGPAQVASAKVARPSRAGIDGIGFMGLTAKWKASRVCMPSGATPAPVNT